LPPNHFLIPAQGFRRRKKKRKGGKKVEKEGERTIGLSFPITFPLDQGFGEENTKKRGKKGGSEDVPATWRPPSPIGGREGGSFFT